jgi:DNA polymerase-3 subunit gamma/tau
LIEALKKFNEAAMTQSSSWQPQLPLEMGFIELLPSQPLPAQPLPTAAPVPLKPVAASAAEPEKVATAVAAQPAQPKSKKTKKPVPTPADPVVEPESAEADLTLELIQGNWREMVNRVGQENKNLPALLNMGRPLAVEGNTAVIGFDYPIFKDKFSNTSGATELLAEILSQLTAVHCNVRAVSTGDYSVPIDKDDFQALADELGGVVSEE